MQASSCSTRRRLLSRSKGGLVRLGVLPGSFQRGSFKGSIGIGLSWLGFITKPALLAVSKGPQSQFRYYWWYRSRRSTDFTLIVLK